MCLFKAPKSSPMASPPPIQPRVDKTSALPDSKPVVDNDTAAKIEYGTGGKKAGPAAGKKTGTDALKINLNTGTETGSKTGGLNV